MLVWAAATSAPVNRALASQEIDRLCRETGAAFIEFWTVRTGFNRIAPQFGYQQRPDVWRGVPITVWKKVL
jgi:hypothetical protein